MAPPRSGPEHPSASVGGRGPLSVTQALSIARHALGAVTLSVTGEVSEVSDKPGYKACYFTLRDERAALPCLMWHDIYAKSGIRLRKGMLVDALGTFDVYIAKGRMNFSVRSLKLAGEGDLRQRVAALAEKLRREGLMEPGRKKALPRLPERIAVVTSPRGKAVHDCLRTLRRRFPLAGVYVCGVPVEGEGAPAAIVEGLRVAESSGAEVILLVRGGGSYEDLMPFNDESLARAVAACSVPVVTGIGHEPDNSIADMVADRRCSTPTAAAEAVVPDVSDVRRQLDRQGSRLAISLKRNVERSAFALDRLASRPVLRDPTSTYAEFWLALDGCSDRLTRALPDMLDRNEERMDHLRGRLARVLPDAVGREEERARHLQERLVRSRTTYYSTLGQSIALFASRLQDLSPLNVLSRGYSLTYDRSGVHVIDSVDEVAVGDELQVSLSDGSFSCSVLSKRHRERAE
jgi:exodeoxyribonuclease VII large subunit